MYFAKVLLFVILVVLTQIELQSHTFDQKSEVDESRLTPETIQGSSLNLTPKKDDYQNLILTPERVDSVDQDTGQVSHFQDHGHHRFEPGIREIDLDLFLHGYLNWLRRHLIYEIPPRGVAFSITAKVTPFVTCHSNRDSAHWANQQGKTLEFTARAFFLTLPSS